MNRLEGSKVQERIFHSVRTQVDEKTRDQMALLPWMRGIFVTEEVLVYTRDKLKSPVLDAMDDWVSL